MNLCERCGNYPNICGCAEAKTYAARLVEMRQAMDELHVKHGRSMRGIEQLEARLAEEESAHRVTAGIFASTLVRADAAEARLAEAERDAARYRFLRDQDGMGNIFIHTPTCELDATIDREIAADSADDVINAQHDETGRTWRGPRSQLPSRYFEVDEICCLDYPRCDCNSPPEPDNEWHCSQYPGCECFAGCREKALEGRREPLDHFEEGIADALGYKVRP